MNAPAPVGALDRRTYLGSSDIAAILGLSNWKTPLEVWLEKMGQRHEEPDPEKARLFARGRRQEPVIIETIEEEWSLQIVARGQRYRDPEYPWMAAEVDAEAIDNGEHVNVEAKSVLPFLASNWGEAGTDECPIYYACQALYALMVTGRQRCIVAAQFGAYNIVRYEIVRDEEVIAGMRARAVAFWNDHVIAKVPPPPITIDDVNRLLSRGADVVVELPDEMANVLAQYRRAKAQAKAADEAAEELKFQIGTFVLGAEKIAAPSKSPAYRLLVGGEEAMRISFQSQQRIDAKEVRRKYPAVAEECGTTSEFFRFDLPRGKKK